MRLYLISAISEKGTLIYQLCDKPVDAKAIVAFLQLLLSTCREKIMIIRDNASIHDCAVTRAFLQSHNHNSALHLVKQPK